jgi:hypothetical protein
MQVKGQPRAQGALSPGDISPTTHWLEGRVGVRTGLDAVEKG